MLARGEEPPRDGLEIVEGADLLDVDAERRTRRHPDEGEPAGAGEAERDRARPLAGAEARLAGGFGLEHDLAGGDPRVAGEDAAQERPPGDERALVHRRDQPPGPLAFGG